MTASPHPGNGAVGQPWGEWAFALLVVAAAGLVWFGTADLPPPRYEPVGSAALPRALAALMALLAIIVAVRARPVPRAVAAGPGTGEAAWVGPLRVAALGALLVLFVALMEARIVGFRPAAVVFLFIAAAVLGGIAPRRLAGYAVFAVVLSLGLHAIFTRLFYIDLP
ncbi:MAG: hypothetical protein AcusKO_20070 [Acuticoccus sp.]